MKLNKNRKIALYIVWAFLHLILFLTSGNLLSGYNSKFFPFPIYQTTEIITYPYYIYLEFSSRKIGEGSYEEFYKKIQKPENLNTLYTLYKFYNYNMDPKVDSMTFIGDIKKSIDKYGDQQFRIKSISIFPVGYKQYDYSEFIIYLLLPLFLGYFKKLWFS